MISGISLQNAIPSEVVSLIFDNGFTPARAWREYLQLTQEECARKLGISQAASHEKTAVIKLLFRI